jgi:hypothetical protein
MLVSILGQFVGHHLLLAAAAALPHADPCKLVTQAEAESIIGERLSPPTRQNLGDITACLYHTPEQGRGMLAVYVGKVDDDQSKEAFEEPGKIKDSNMRKEPGLGDDAMSFTMNMMGTKLAQVNARRGKQVIMVQLRRKGAAAGGEEDRKLAVRAAKLAIGRLS